jgi:hypothetical protein
MSFQLLQAKIYSPLDCISMQEEGVINNTSCFSTGIGYDRSNTEWCLLARHGMLATTQVAKHVMSLK